MNTPHGDPVKLVSQSVIQSVGRACTVSYREFYRGWNEPRGSRQGWPASIRATLIVSQLPSDYIIGVHTSYLKEASGALNASRFLPVSANVSSPTRLDRGTRYTLATDISLQTGRRASGAPLTLGLVRDSRDEGSHESFFPLAACVSSQGCPALCKLSLRVAMFSRRRHRCPREAP